MTDTRKPHFATPFQIRRRPADGDEPGGAGTGPLAPPAAPEAAPPPAAPPAAGDEDRNGAPPGPPPTTQAPLELGAEDPREPDAEDREDAAAVEPPPPQTPPAAGPPPDEMESDPENGSPLLLDQFKTENGSVVLDARQVAELEAFVQQVDELRADYQRLQEAGQRSAAEEPAGGPEDAPIAVDIHHLRRAVAELRACAWWQTARREWLLDKLAGLVGEG